MSCIEKEPFHRVYLVIGDEEHEIHYETPLKDSDVMNELRQLAAMTTAAVGLADGSYITITESLRRHKPVYFIAKQIWG